MTADQELSDTNPSQSSLSDEQVRDFLKANGDFLQRNPDLLDHLKISHASGSAVSLVEKQVSVLRERNVEMRHRLTTLTNNARDNDKLYEQTRCLVLALLEVSNLEELNHAFIGSMSRDFKVEHASLILFGEPNSAGDCRVEPDDVVNSEIGALFKGNKPVCGVLRKEELSYLFPKAKDVGSAALMPLSADTNLGLIAIGSSDANKYGSNMGTLFLTHIAEVIVRLLPKLSAASHSSEQA